MTSSKREKNVYISFSNAWFREYYKTDNKAFKFQNNFAGDGFDNTAENWEVALLSIDFKNLQFIGPDALYRVSTNFIRPYQHGTSKAQTMATFFLGSRSQSEAKLEKAVHEVRDIMLGVISRRQAYHKAQLAEKKRKAESSLMGKLKKATGPSDSTPGPSGANVRVTRAAAANDETLDKQVAGEAPKKADDDEGIELHLTIAKPVYYPLIKGKLQVAEIVLRPLFRAGHTVNAAQTILQFHFRRTDRKSDELIDEK